MRQLPGLNFLKIGSVVFLGFSLSLLMNGCSTREPKLEANSEVAANGAPELTISVKSDDETVASKKASAPAVDKPRHRHHRKKQEVKLDPKLTTPQDDFGSAKPKETVDPGISDGDDKPASPPSDPDAPKQDPPQPEAKGQENSTNPPR